MKTLPVNGGSLVGLPTQVTVPPIGPGASFCWTRAKFLETSSSLRPSNFREISGKSVTTGDRQGTAPPSMSRRPTTSPTPKHSAHHPVVVSKHESCADGISKGADLLLPKHELQEVGFPWKFPEISGMFVFSWIRGVRLVPKECLETWARAKWPRASVRVTVSARKRPLVRH